MHFRNVIDEVVTSQVVHIHVYRYTDSHKHTLFKKITKVYNVPNFRTERSSYISFHCNNFYCHPNCIVSKWFWKFRLISGKELFVIKTLALLSAWTVCTLAGLLSNGWDRCRPCARAWEAVGSTRTLGKPSAAVTCGQLAQWQDLPVGGWPDQEARQSKQMHETDAMLQHARHTGAAQAALNVPHTTAGASADRVRVLLSLQRSTQSY